eukprot:10439271-Karenia_brevis.AAC.1
MLLLVVVLLVVVVLEWHQLLDQAERQLHDVGPSPALAAADSVCSVAWAVEAVVPWKMESAHAHAVLVAPQPGRC